MTAAGMPGATGGPGALLDRMSSFVRAAPENLPFELRALEVVLDTVCVGGGRRLRVPPALSAMMACRCGPAAAWPPCTMRQHKNIPPVLLPLNLPLPVMRWGTQVAKYLEKQTADLEAAAHPALDALTVAVSSHSSYSRGPP